MSEKYSVWLTKLKKKYRSEIDKLQEEEYRYLVTNYRFEGSTLIFIFNIQLSPFVKPFRNVFWPILFQDRISNTAALL